MGQHKTNGKHHRKKAAMATSLRKLRKPTTYSRSFRHSLTTTIGKSEKFHPPYIRSAAVASPPTRESRHPAACANRQFPSAGHVPKHESSPACALPPAATGWKA